MALLDVIRPEPDEEPSGFGNWCPATMVMAFGLPLVMLVAMLLGGGLKTAFPRSPLSPDAPLAHFIGLVVVVGCLVLTVLAFLSIFVHTIWAFIAQTWVLATHEELGQRSPWFRGFPTPH